MCNTLSTNYINLRKINVWNNLKLIILNTISNGTNIASVQVFFTTRMSGILVKLEI
jgi:hypothetical protein